MKKTLIGLGIVVVLLGLFALSSYNRLVTAQETVNNSFAQVEIQYQRRFDLIPNLVASVKGIMTQEQKVFTELAEARTRYSGASTPEDKLRATGDVEGALGRLLVITENYPQLKSSDTVVTLMSQLEGTENRVSAERGRYNDAVKAYNLKIKTIPTSFFASLFGFTEKPYFESASGSDKSPQVSF